MAKSQRDFKVISNTPLNADHFVLELTCTEPIGTILPGQFATISVDHDELFSLRRPFSFYGRDIDRNSVSFLIKVIGRGTRYLSERKPGDSLSLLFPLGNGFSYPEKRSEVLVVGGGSGVAPLLFLADELKGLGHSVDILIGARSADTLVELDKFAGKGELLITTEDGSVGEKGYPTQHSCFRNLQHYSIIYTCGPDAMMRAIAQKAKEAQVPCEVSLENTMACGFGVCLCCVTETVEGNKCVCTKGPVFNTNYLKW